MAVTIKEIAKKAGVSRSTVARALNDHPKISLATKQKVHQIAQELGYVPNYIAQSLSNNRTQTIGVVIAQVTDPFNWNVIEGIDLAAHNQGYSVLVATARNDRQREFEIIETFHRRRVDGIIVSSSHMGSYHSQVLQKIDIPVILINEPEPEGVFRSVSINDMASVQQGLNYLIDIGHQRIVYVGSANRPKSNARRYKAYRGTLRVVGLPVHDEIIAEAGQSDIETGRAAAKRVINTQATAVLCYNDRVALGLNAALREKGIAIPDAISIMGFDDIDEATYAVPRLTTIRQPQMQLGEYAVTMLLEMLEGHEVSNLILPCELVVRDSTQAPARQET
ncbi:MAG: LacI family DNA-binding transcriptional regulator [Anaerolineae bacterium]|nr:LacI family DNA-binding transcriptional regulator [Anaerolineae bacterium]